MSECDGQCSEARLWQVIAQVLIRRLGVDELSIPEEEIRKIAADDSVISVWNPQGAFILKLMSLADAKLVNKAAKTGVRQ